MALVTAVPGVAQPLCAATCGDGPAARTSCCCAAERMPDDGTPSYSAPPCCPSPAAGADRRELAGSVDNGTSAPSVRGPGQVPAIQNFIAATGVGSCSVASLFGDPAGARATGPPIFISLSSLRL